MAEQKPQDGAAQLEADVRRAVELGLDLQERVRQLTLQQIASGCFDLAALRELSQAVVNGAIAGVQPALAQTGRAREAMQQAVAGLDAALARTAQTAALALQEAADKAQAYSATDLARARDDLGQLETMLLETLQGSAASARDAAGTILGELADHARRNGSAVGGQLHELLSTTASQLGEMRRAQLDAGLQIAQAGGDLMRQIAAGVLAGLAERVRPAARPDRDS